jgi:hypothetical protein
MRPRQDSLDLRLGSCRETDHSGTPKSQTKVQSTVRVVLVVGSRRCGLLHAYLIRGVLRGGGSRAADREAGRARTTSAVPGEIEMKQLIAVFGWCEDNGKKLAHLAVSENLHK